MKGYSADQIRAAEGSYLDAGEPLMQRAAAGLAEIVTAEVGESATILVLVGAGDNGGDALYAAAILAETGHDIRISRVADRVHEASLAAALEAGAALTDDPVGAAEDADVIIDGILGTGSSGGLRGRAREVVGGLRPILASEESPLVIAVDIPSGVDPTTGAVPDAALPADITVTFAAAKAGLLIAPGADYAGEIVVVDIGIGDAVHALDPVVDVA